jgi:hypothetical protein
VPTPRMEVECEALWGPFGISVSPVRMNAADTNSSSEHCGVAIVGMSGRFSGAGCIGVFWKNLRDGVESISRLSGADLDAAGSHLNGDSTRATSGPLRC